MSDKVQRPAGGAAANSAGTGEEAAALSVVSGLMEERQRFESWIAALDARRATTEESVYVRVHADYSARLDAVIEQLGLHTDGLRGQLTSLATRLAALRERQQQARDERSEAEVRAHVGELSPSDWEQTAAASDARMAALAASHVVLEQELHRTRELLGHAERPVTTGSSMKAVPETPTAPVTPSPPMVEDQSAYFAPPLVPEPTAPPRGRGSFDELAFLSSVVDTPPPGSSPRKGKQAEPVRRDSHATKDADGNIENMDGAAGASVVARTGGERPMAANISGNNPIVIKDKTVDGAKTLRCAECNAMNFPTEWYCERCGAELASL